MQAQDADFELASWLRLAQTAGVGPQTARALLHRFGLPQHIFSAACAELQEVVSDKLARRLCQPADDKLQALIQRTLAWSAEPSNHVLTLADRHYPQALLNIHDPPIILYAKGKPEWLSRPMLAIVGSRNATAQGISNAEKFAETLSQAGLTVVSGLALGIDTAAHSGALRSSGTTASTIAVIGTGADIVYPARNRELAHRIAESGCLLSEYPLGTPAIASNFPRRNRIISGLAAGVLVVEAAAQSGSLITARMALDQGREVFAIPGSIHSPLAKGCHQLIKQGAKLVESAQDILEELHFAADCGDKPAATAPSEGSASTADPFLAALGFDPVHIDALTLRWGCEVAATQAELLRLELEGYIERLPGEYYRRL